VLEGVVGAVHFHTPRSLYDYYISVGQPSMTSMGSGTYPMPREVGRDVQQLHPSDEFRAMVDSHYPSHYSQDGVRDYYHYLSNSPQYSGQYINGYFQTTDPGQRDFLREHPNWPLLDASIAAPEPQWRPLDEMQGRGLHTAAQNPNGPFFSDVQARFRV
jgi:hypothetical protein